MLGVALGDLHGSIWEQSRAPSRVLSPLSGKHTITDDTVLSMAVAQHLLEGAPAADALKQWAAWYPEAGYGGVFKAWALQGGERPVSWGNGALMRIAPVVVLRDTLEEALEAALAINRTTHGHEVALQATRDYIMLLWTALQGGTKQDLLGQWHAWGRPLHGVEAHRQHPVKMRLRADNTLEDVMSCLAESDDFESLLASCLYHGGDTDTIAAIAGALGELLWGVPCALVPSLAPQFDGRIDRQMRLLYDAAAKRYPARWGQRGAQARW